MNTIFNMDEELREIITSAIDLNRAKCTYEEIVADIAPCIQKIYRQGEIEGYKKGLKSVLMNLEQRRRMLESISEPSSPRFRELKEIVISIEKMKEERRNIL